MEIGNKEFLGPEDLVEMGLFKDTGQVFRAVTAVQTRIPPYVRLSRKTIRFPKEAFLEWLSHRIEEVDNVKQCNPLGGSHE